MAEQQAEAPNTTEIVKKEPGETSNSSRDIENAGPPRRGGGGPSRFNNGPGRGFGFRNVSLSLNTAISCARLNWSHPKAKTCPFFSMYFPTKNI